MAIVLIEGHEVHRHVGCISNEARVEQLHWPKAVALVKQIESVENVLGEGSFFDSAMCLARSSIRRAEEIRSVEIRAVVVA